MEESCQDVYYDDLTKKKYLKKLITGEKTKGAS